MIHSVTPVTPLTGIEAASPAGKTGASDFSQLLQDAVKRVNASSAAANAGVEGFLAGDGPELHSVVLATQRASLEFDMFLQVRNKVVQAYQEVMRMQL
jgi:flagellar hook-basal body complex protein FliE